VQKEHWYGTAAAEIDAQRATRRFRRTCWRGRNGGGFPCQRGELVHVIVDRLERTIPGRRAIPRREPPLLRLRPAKNEMPRACASRMSCGHLGQHGDASPRHGSRRCRPASPGGKETARARSTAPGKLIGLHADPGPISTLAPRLADIPDDSGPGPKRDDWFSS